MNVERFLAVGEVHGDAIGCYLFGIEGSPLSKVAYHSVASSHAVLIEDCDRFFKELVRSKQNLIATSQHSVRHQQDLSAIKKVADNLKESIALYLTSNRQKPFLEFGGVTIFLRMGMRQRQMVQGRYVE